MIFRISFVLISATNTRLYLSFNQLGIVVKDNVFKARSVTDQVGHSGFAALARIMGNNTGISSTVSPKQQRANCGYTIGLLSRCVHLRAE